VVVEVLVPIIKRDDGIVGVACHDAVTTAADDGFGKHVVYVFDVGEILESNAQLVEAGIFRPWMQPDM
jgi:hypothetical protein